MSASLNKLREEVEALHRDEQLRLDGEKKEILERIEKQVRKKNDVVSECIVLFPYYLIVPRRFEWNIR